MRTIGHVSTIAALLASSALTGLATNAVAADAPDSHGPALEEVVVTARKRAETVQDAPLTIAVVNPEKLAAVQVTNPNELNGIVPGLTIQAGVGGGPGVTFRGLGSNGALFSVETSVALFVDGVYSAHTRDYINPIYDLDRIEMVKGTQGTLLGKNTTLGAITMVTRKPTSAFGYSVQTSYDFDTRTPRVEAALNLPVSDQLQLRFAGLYVDDGGYMKNAFYGGRPDTRDVSGRIGAVWRPSDDVDVSLTVQHDDHDQTGQALEVLRDASAGNTIRARALAVGQTNFEANPDRRDESASLAFGTAAGRGPPSDIQQTNRANLVANWRAGDFTLTSQTAWVKWDVKRFSDLDFVQANLFGIDDVERNKQISQEIRILSPADRRLTYLFGLFYYDNTWTLNRTTSGAAPVTPNGRVTTYFTQNVKAWSGFGQATLNITDALSGSLGLRYTHERKAADLFRPAGVGSLGTAFPAYPATRLTNTEGDLDGDAGLQYKFAPGRMVYVSASKGSKAGGLQTSPTTLAGAPYKGETAYTVEAGGKFAFDRATLDVAVFQTTVDGFQFARTAPIGTPPVVQSLITNVDVRSRGVEVNGAWRVTDALRLNGGVVYADAVASETVPLPPETPALVDGLRQPRAPKWSGNLDANYTQAVTQDLTLKVLGSLEFASKTYLQPNFGASLGAPYRGQYGKLNLRVALANDTAGWEVALLGKNLTDVDEPLFTSSITGTGAGGNTAAWYGTVMPGRTVVLQFNIKR